MIWKRGGAERGYHHGNLREALIRAALDLIAQKGPAGFTFAEAARWAGVSPAAPYRHFRDRDELMADVARQGFELFERRWRRPGTTAGPIRRPPSSGSARPISISRAASPPTIRRCSKPVFRSTPIRSCARRATAPSRCCAAAARRCSRRCCRRQAAAGADDGAAYLVAVARHRLAVRARRRRHGASCRWRPRTCWRPAVLIYLQRLGLHGEKRRPATPKARGLTAGGGARYVNVINIHI